MDNFFHSLYTELVWFLKTRARLGFNTSQQRDAIKLSGVKTVSKETKAGFYFAEVVFLHAFVMVSDFRDLVSRTVMASQRLATLCVSTLKLPQSWAHHSEGGCSFLNWHRALP